MTSLATSNSLDQMLIMQTFLWHDYETWGIDPALDKPSQFAAIRTDQQLSEVGEPSMFYCQPAADTLPHAEACLVTGITPQKAHDEGVPEYQFAEKIQSLMAQKDTCVVGYNSLRFDDEVTRHLFFRNFYDPYEREWKNGNSRFDIIDVVRMCAALRPEGIEWPLNAEGKRSFRLEHLTAANGIEQEGAHDALVDVRATIALAKLLQEKQPKLWNWALKMRSKHYVLETLAVGELKPLVHISGMFKSEFLHASLVLPLCEHPTNKNAIICFDLRYAPDDFLQLSPDEIYELAFTRTEDLGGRKRIPLKNIHINKCPMIAPIAMLDDEVAARIGLNLQSAREHYKQLKSFSGLVEKARAVFDREHEPKPCDVEKSLYSGGFLNAHDKALCSQV
ncbi:MAG: exodeoxyribonuclease I, partial [Sinobacterium sp.]|nr:exodeoxyribonuclease I [Sinobacterium sp.]